MLALLSFENEPKATQSPERATLIMQPPLLTVLICTHNRAGLLKRALASIYAANQPDGWQVDILVLANACTDSTHALLEAEQDNCVKTGSWLTLDWLPEPEAGKSFALNAAIPRVRQSNIVTFVDDDHRIDEQYLVEICRAADKHPEISMFCGRILPEWDGTEPAWVHDEGAYRIRPLPIPRSDGGPNCRELTLTDATPGGGNLFLRGSVFDRVGEFPTKLGPHGHDLGGGEDSVFVERALSRGERLMYIPEVLQHHYVDQERLKFGYILRKAYQRARSTVMSQHRRSGVPAYQWRKLGEYIFSTVLAFSPARFRFYLVRVATTLGEIAGLTAIKRRPASRPEEKVRNRMYFASIAILFGIGAIAALSHPESQLIVGIEALTMTATFFAVLLGVKSIADFTHTGPQLKDEILRHYRRYSIFAFLRLLGYSFLILCILGVPGVGAYFAWSELSGITPTFGLSIAAVILSVSLFSAMQFSRHLLLLPANIVASYNYRVSRLFSYWRCLSASRLRFATAVLLGGPAALLALAVFTLLAEGDFAGAVEYASILLFYVVLGLWLRPSKPQPVTAKTKSQSPNILMIGSDTLRSDRLDGTYSKNVAPYLKHMAEQGTLFSQCYVPCARTAPSLLALLTGSWPHRFGVRDNYVPDEATHLPVETLPGILNKHGYYTAALSDWCGADMGKFDLGFDYTDVPEDQWNTKLFIRQGPKDLRLFLSLFGRNRFGKYFLPEIYYLGGVPQTDELGLEAQHLISHLAAQSQPFFLNIFFSTTHGPFGSEYPYYTRFADPNYRGESKFVMARLTDPWEIIQRQAEPREAFDLDQIINLYDGCVARFDDEVKRLMDHLGRCGLLENTIVVVYSDHGMEFFEHQTWGQGNSAISDVSNRIPLLIHSPMTTQGRNFTHPVRSIDLAPTLLEMAGIAHGHKMDGVSLKPFLDEHGAAPELDAFSETGIWLADLPGTPVGHLRYPKLLDLLTVRDIETSTISIKPEYVDIIVRAKDRMIRKGRWKLVYQPLIDGYLLKLFDMLSDPACTTDVLEKHRDVANRLWEDLQNWLLQDAAYGQYASDTKLKEQEQARAASMENAILAQVISQEGLL